MGASSTGGTGGSGVLAKEKLGASISSKMRNTKAAGAPQSHDPTVDEKSSESRGEMLLTPRDALVTNV